MNIHCIYLGDIWGNIISSTVFAVTPGNTTNDIDSCGANFDPTAPTGNNSNLDRPDDTKVCKCLSFIKCSNTLHIHINLNNR